MHTIITTCVICGSSNSRSSDSLARRLGLLEPFGVTMCCNCNFCWQSPRPTQNEMEAFYTHVYFGAESDATADWMDDYPAPAHSTRRYSEEGRLFASEQQDFHLSLIERFKKLDGKELLEIGFGRGGFLKRARDHGFNVCGVEPSANAVREAVAEGLEAYQGTMEDIPDQVRARSWDVIFMSHVFEHIPDPGAATKVIWDLLSDGGIIVLEVPNQFEGWATRCRDLLMKISGRKRPSNLYSVHHLNFFASRHLERLFTSERFEVMTTSWTPKRFDSIPRSVRSIIEWVGERTAKQGSNIQLVAYRPDTKL